METHFPQYHNHEIVTDIDSDIVDIASDIIDGEKDSEKDTTAKYCDVLGEPRDHHPIPLQLQGKPGS